MCQVFFSFTKTTEKFVCDLYMDLVKTGAFTVIFFSHSCFNWRLFKIINPSLVLFVCCQYHVRFLKKMLYSRKKKGFGIFRTLNWTLICHFLFCFFSNKEHIKQSSVSIFSYKLLLKILLLKSILVNFLISTILPNCFPFVWNFKSPFYNIW